MDPYRLPRTAVPRRYDLRLEPDLASASFTGEVVVDLLLHEELSTIVLNAAELRIDSAWVRTHSGTVPARVALDEATERCRLQFDELLPATEVLLHLSFQGTLNDKL